MVEIAANVSDYQVAEEHTDGSLLPPDEELLCDRCDALVGVQDTIAKGWRLFKTSLDAELPSTGESEGVHWESHPTELVVAAQLLELIERESARRFIIHCGKKDGLLVSRPIHLGLDSWPSRLTVV